MKDPFPKIPFQNVLEVPLKACADAQRQVTDSILKLLKEELLSVDKNGKLQPAYMTFQFNAGNGVNLLRIPLLNLFPLPSLQIDSIDFSYLVNITQYTKNDFKVKYSGQEVTYTSEEQLESQLEVRLHAGVADMPMGLAKLYQLLDDACTTIK